MKCAVKRSRAKLSPYCPLVDQILHADGNFLPAAVCRTRRKQTFTFYEQNVEVCKSTQERLLSTCRTRSTLVKKTRQSTSCVPPSCRMRPIRLSSSQLVESDRAYNAIQLNSTVVGVFNQFWIFCLFIPMSRVGSLKWSQRQIRLSWTELNKANFSRDLAFVTWVNGLWLRMAYNHFTPRMVITFQFLNWNLNCYNDLLIN